MAGVFPFPGVREGSSAPGEFPGHFVSCNNSAAFSSRITDEGWTPVMPPPTSLENSIFNHYHGMSGRDLRLAHRSRPDGSTGDHFCPVLPGLKKTGHH